MYCFYAAKVYLETFCIDNKAKEFNLSLEEKALFCITKQFELV